MLDSWIISKFEKFTDFTESWIGKDNIFCTRLSFLFSSISIFLAFPKYDIKITVLVAIFSIASFGSLYTGTMTAEDAKKKHDAENKGYANWQKHAKELILFRLISMAVWICSPIVVKFYKGELGWSFPLAWLFLWIGAVFMACDSKPRKPSKLKEWINSFSHKPVMQEN
jgi:hypothetical protein